MASLSPCRVAFFLFCHLGKTGLTKVYSSSSSTCNLCKNETMIGALHCIFEASTIPIRRTRIKMFLIHHYLVAVLHLIDSHYRDLPRLLTSITAVRAPIQIGGSGTCTLSAGDHVSREHQLIKGLFLPARSVINTAWQRYCKVWGCILHPDHLDEQRQSFALMLFRARAA